MPVAALTFFAAADDVDERGPIYPGDRYNGFDILESRRNA